jgi:hypothetical protein
MIGIQKMSHTDECREIIIDWNYCDSCTKTSFSVRAIENIRQGIFVAQNAV